MKFVLLKFRGIWRESMILIRKEKAFFFAPMILALILIALLIYHAGPAIVVAFIYAGV